MIKSVIFDLDGVIVSTDEYHYQAWQIMANNYKIPFDRETNEKLRGVSRAESLEIILREADMQFNSEQKRVVMNLKNQLYVDSLKQLTENDILPGVMVVLNMLKEMKLPIAIGSSSKNAQYILGRIGLTHYFDFVADGTQIKNSKPHPEVFLLAAEKLGIEPQHCLVLEDAESGVEAAHNANMQVLAVGAAASCQQADYTAYNLSRFDWQQIFA